MIEPHQMFTTWSGVSGEPDVWCLTCSAGKDEPVPWQRCANNPTNSEGLNP